MEVNTTTTTILHDNTMTPVITGIIVSVELMRTFEYVVDLCICSFSSYMGIVGNILTIIVFSKMGFKETVNISMTAIAIWDLIKCICLVVTRWYGPIKMVSAGLAMSWFNVATIVGGFFTSISGYVSGALAAYVAIERCLCISLPFTVKTLLTRKVVKVTCVTISVLVTISYLVIYLAFEFVEVTDATTNETFMIFQRSALDAEFPGLMIYIFAMSMLYPAITLCIMCVCTVIIVYHLKKASKFRLESKAMQTTDGSSQLSARDRQVIKMLVVVILVYIVCLFPRVAFFMTVSVFPDFDAHKRYNNLFWVCVYLLGNFDALNSSTNIFIFYCMSSQFKSTTNQILRIKQK